MLTPLTLHPKQLVKSEPPHLRQREGKKRQIQPNKKWIAQEVRAQASYFVIAISSVLDLPVLVSTVGGGSSCGQFKQGKIIRM